MAFIALDGAIEEPRHTGTQQIVLDVGAQIRSAFDGQPLALEKGEHVRILIHVVEQTVISVDGSLKAEGLPDQIRDHAPRLPTIVRITPIEESVEQPILTIVMIRIFTGETCQQDHTLATVTRISRNRIRLRQGAQPGDDGRSIGHVGVFSQEIVPAAIDHTATAIVRKVTRCHVPRGIVIARIPFAAEHALDLVRMVDRVDRVRAPRIDGSHIRAVHGADGTRFVFHGPSDLRRRLQQPHELVALRCIRLCRTIVGPDVVAKAVSGLDPLEGCFGPIVTRQILARRVDAFRRVVRRPILRRDHRGHAHDQSSCDPEYPHHAHRCRSPRRFAHALMWHAFPL